MSNNTKAKIALICIVCLLTSMFCGFSPVSESAQASEPVSTYTDIPILVDGHTVCRGSKIDDVTFIPLTTFCKALGLEAESSWDEETAILTVALDGMTITYHAGDNYMQANGRYLFLDGGVYKVDRVFVFPIRSAAKIFGIDVRWNGAAGNVSLDTKNQAFLTSGSEFYNAEDLYWLSHIINAEAGNQSLDGKIGVGNVVLNRVESPSCPDTIYGVIFDTRYGVQFSPIENGAIYNEPNEESVVAAKLCLEGYETVGASLFFLNPDGGAKNWFENTRTFIVSIGDHDFYA